MINRHKPFAYSVLATCFVLLLCHLIAPTANAKDNWTSVRSKNFLLVGNASDKQIRQVATRLEQFRDTFSLLFHNARVNSPVPTTVIVFKNDSSYRPFKPGPNVAGYFQSGEDVNYITLNTELQGEQDAFTVIFHEYVHLLVNNTIGNSPAWFNEGLAEYYSTFTIEADQKVTLGKPIGSHVYLLRENKILPLRTLFAVDHDSPYYNERDKQSIFYAESWALMHYLIQGNQRRRLPQLGAFMDLLGKKVAVAEAFQKAFQTTFEAMEKELKEYVTHDRYPVTKGYFERKLQFETEMQSAPITEAQAQAYLGDLLLHSNRADAEGYLQKAISLDPSLGIAHASLGLLRSRQGKFDEARQLLEKAVAANTQNYLAHYYYALALSRQGMDAHNIVYNYAPATLQTMRVELGKAIELAPGFAESYHLLAFINLVAGDRADESIALLKRALLLAPGKQEYVFMLAQLYLRQEDFAQAKQTLQPLAKEGADPQLRQDAQGLLNQIASIDELKARGAARNNSPPGAGSTKEESVMAQPAEVSVDPLSDLGEALRKPAAGEIRVLGTLVRIDCGSKWIVLTVKTGDRLLKVQTDAFENMKLSTFTETVSGDITCGLRKNADVVVLTYKQLREPRAKTDGTAMSLEFVPKDFKLEP